MRTEADLSALAGEDFSPTYMRNATVYGVSPRLRTDIVVHNLVGLAHVTGEILLTSAGSSWRPLVHVEDVCRAFRAVLEAPRAAVHDEAFNVGRTDENYLIRQVAQIVADALPGTEIALPDSAGPDPRDYRVDCSKLEASFPAHRPRWTVPEGVEELRDAFREHGLSADDLRHRYVRLDRIDRLQDEGRLDDQLRWNDASANGGSNRPSDGSRRESGSAALVLRGKEFWDHHRRWLATVDRRLEWGRLAWMVTLEGLRLLLNPLNTGRRLVQRLRRNTSA